MVGLSVDTPHPTDTTVHTQSRVLQIASADDKQFSLSFKYLCALSPSAGVQGHGPGREVLQIGKRKVGIVGVEPVDNYMIRPLSSDGHDSGIFNWTYLCRLGIEHGVLWQAYLDRPTVVSVDRDAPMVENASHTCGHSH